ncbi:ABC transporter permease [Thermomicrobium sp. 4228-Ro]|uniref:ABC transporter permease n=1 Tax=Thermomicrobium sp. 4228-Ro TaxID=2993937 RepID=UPI0022498D4F|nr:ABC transporter permease [Thermomicrobium sp. 4228-Ro]MCX2728178.1 ABC transporter permease [Thermomicrobium sp. 4228-Ro]
MRGLVRLIWLEFLLQLREPFAAFFPLAFPPLLILLFGSIYGNEPKPELGGLGTIDVTVPGYIALVLATVGIFNLPISLASYRERGFLRRLAVTPLSPFAIFLAHLVSLALLTVCGILLLVLVAKAGYHLRFPGSLPSAIAAGMVGGLALYAFGFALAALAPTARTAQVASMLLFYPMLFLSGMALPREILPERVQQVATVFPATPVVTVLRAAWENTAWWQHESQALLVLALWTIASLAVAAWRFRWE